MNKKNTSKIYFSKNIFGVFYLDEKIRINHNVIIEDRKKFTLTGVKDVLSFEQDNIVLETSLGKLSVKGSLLKIVSFENQGGDLSGEGNIYALIYSDEEKSEGFFSRIFR